MNGEFFAVRYAGGGAQSISLAHGVDRIEALGSNTIVIGSDGRDLHFPGLRLADRPARRTATRARTQRREKRAATGSTTSQ